MTEEQIIEHLAKTGCVFAIACTGGGGAAVPELMSYGGASKWLADFSIPYSQLALETLVAQEVKKAASAETARNMAFAMFARAFTFDAPRPVADHFATLSPGSGRPFGHTFGIGTTAVLKKENERPGREYVVHVAAYCAVPVFNDKHVLEATYIPTGQTRREQEQQASYFIQHFLLLVAAQARG